MYRQQPNLHNNFGLKIQMYSIQVIFVVTVSWLAAVAADSSISTTYRLLEGSNNTITCNTTESPDVHIYWTKGDSQGVFQSGLRLELTETPRNDSGNYACHRVNMTGHNQNRTVEVAEIDVIYPAEITEFSVEPAVVSENQTITIKCNVAGNPSPTWEIRHNVTYHVVYRSDKSGAVNITVKAVCGDNGAFKCTGNNTLNDGINATMGQAVNVFCSPRPRPIKLHNRIMNTFLGSFTYFIEAVIGYPAPTYTWSRDDGRPMGNVTYISLPTVAALKISNVQISDLGNYTLHMNNTRGSYTSKYALIPSPYAPPMPPTNLTFSDVTASSVHLNWTSGYDMGGEMSFQVTKLTRFGWIQLIKVPSVQYEDHGVGQRWSYNLTDLTEGTMYILAVEAIKPQGVASDSSNIITFNTTATPAPPSHHRLSTGAVVAISVGLAVFASVLIIAVVVILLRRERGNRRRR